MADLEGRWYAASVGTGWSRVVLSGSRRETDGGGCFQTEPNFAPGNAEEVFARRYYAPDRFSNGRTYDISPDGERFLMIKESAGGDSTELILVQNWFEELKRLVPTDN